MGETKKKIPQLTGIRGVIAFVIAYILHWYLLFDAVPWKDNPFLQYFLINFGTIYLYVPDVFFVISGYLIHKSYYLRISESNMSFKDFILPKAKRIYPIMIFTCCVTWGLQEIGMRLFGYYPLHSDGGEVRNSILSLILSCIGLQSGYFSNNDTRAVNGPTWFVAVLLLCYLLYYLITRYVKKVGLQYLIYILLVIFGVVLLANPVNYAFMYTVNARGYIGFFMGVLIGAYSKFISDEKINKISYIIVLLIFSVATYLQHTQELKYYACNVCLIIWPGLVYLLIYGHILKKIFSLNIFMFLGKISMPIFLCNFPTDLIIKICDLYFGLELDYKNTVFWGVHIVVSLIIAYICHLLFEGGWKRIKSIE